MVNPNTPSEINTKAAPSRFQRLMPGLFFKHVAVLAGGTALATAIPVLVSPILTRLYAPESFGVLAVFTAIVAALSPAVCGKFEVALVLPRSNRQSRELFGIALWWSAVFSGLIFVTALIFSGPILALLKSQNLRGWIYLVPLSLFLTGLMTAMTYYANRGQDYANMARSKMVRSCSVALVGIILGFAKFGAAGLLSGVIIGTMTGAGYLFYTYRHDLSSRVLQWNPSKTALVKRFKDYPLLNATSGLLNGLTVSMPVFFLANYFPGEVVGFFALVMRVAEAPMALISPAVSQVNLKAIVDYQHNNQWNRIYAHLLKTTMTLLGIICLPSVLLWFYSPELFALLFGKNWKGAGTYMQILLPALVVRFLVSSVSSTYGALNKNMFAFGKRIFAFGLGIFLFWFVGRGISHPSHFMFLIAGHIIAAETVGLAFIVWAAKDAEGTQNPAG